MKRSIAKPQLGLAQAGSPRSGERSALVQTANSRLGEIVTVTLGNFADSRLGEAISPERDSSLLKKQPLAWAKVRAEKFGRASTILAWARRARLGENISSRPCSRIHGSTPNQKYIFQPFPSNPTAY
ncbi:hypothetical protein DEO72_LG2g4532 [Vigna unguiculata]|uniref:Uncharacterized protein n=1 Tax=Vigna unguiculata TaxID=3917 RepID=A0A4D6L6L6_VIGUN|nr:hypothetical protein DEO72_LG2g4532 [Vigna unguiculata]